jgi:GntR family transcriptional repressor for pyruvate dehydrogenase complex
LRSRSKPKKKHQKPNLVLETAAKLRESILACAPVTRLGSLQDVAQLLDVGIVTVQQAARILEHEGLLQVRRGPGGGYYGMRPDEAALERAFAAYLRVHGFGYHESQEMMSLFDCEIVPAATRCKDTKLREAIRALSERVDKCESVDDRIAFEIELRELLFRMVARPLIEMLCRVTLRLHSQPPTVLLFPGKEDVAAWKSGRLRILNAILERDEELARFEAERYRRVVLAQIRKNAASDSPS